MPDYVPHLEAELGRVLNIRSRYSTGPTADGIPMHALLPPMAPPTRLDAASSPSIAISLQLEAKQIASSISI